MVRGPSGCADAATAPGFGVDGFRLGRGDIHLSGGGGQSLAAGFGSPVAIGMVRTRGDGVRMGARGISRILDLLWPQLVVCAGADARISGAAPPAGIRGE